MFCFLKILKNDTFYNKDQNKANAYFKIVLFLMPFNFLLRLFLN